jgi:predicted enzyme related to lactoylglutathione lyase
VDQVEYDGQQPLGRQLRVELAGLLSPADQRAHRVEDALLVAAKTMTEDEQQSTSIPGLVHGQLCYLQIPALEITASARFYERVFGWEVDPPDSGFEAPSLIGQWITDRPPSPDAGPVGWILVDDLRGTLEQPEQAGATLRDAPSADGPRWLAASFSDPAGNLVGLAQHGGARRVSCRSSQLL